MKKLNTFGALWAAMLAGAAIFKVEARNVRNVRAQHGFAARRSGRSRYMPHQGAQETARRLRQIKAGQHNGTPIHPSKP